MKTKGFDIRERTLKYAVRIVRLVRRFPKDSCGIVLGNQLIRAGTSIGANMEEADGASTRKEFFHRVSISRKEAKETRYWLRVISATELLDATGHASEVESLIEEATEIVNILSAIIKKNDQ
ncbi:MAG TPA: four helix bundle protein [bacterium]|nr:four helix bundle protein [bacterium]